MYNSHTKTAQYRAFSDVNTSIEDKQEMDFSETFSETLANTAAWRAER